MKFTEALLLPRKSLTIARVIPWADCVQAASTKPERLA
jgi:hypothetical protein